MFKLNKDGSNIHHVRGVNSPFDAIVWSFDEQTLLGVHINGYSLMTSTDNFESVHEVAKPLPVPGSGATAFVPISTTKGAISSNFGSPTKLHYTIDIVSLV